MSELNKNRPNAWNYEHVIYTGGEYKVMPYLPTPFINGDGSVNIPKTNEFIYLHESRESKEWMVMRFGKMVYTIFINEQTNYNPILYVNELNDDASAKAYVHKKLNEKTKKGYVDQGIIKVKYVHSDNTLDIS